MFKEPGTPWVGDKVSSREQGLHLLATHMLCALQEEGTTVQIGWS